MAGAYPVNYVTQPPKQKTTSGWGAGLGSMFGGAIGLTGFLGGPMLGALTSSLGSGIGQWAGNELELGLAPTMVQPTAPPPQFVGGKYPVRVA